MKGEMLFLILIGKVFRLLLIRCLKIWYVFLFCFCYWFCWKIVCVSVVRILMKLFVIV